MEKGFVGGNKYVKNISLKQSQINEKYLKKLLFENNKTKFVLGYISPHLDFYHISKKIKSVFGNDIKVLLSTSAGELCNIELSNQKSIYMKTGDFWDTIVLQSFSDNLIKSVDIHTVYLYNDDIKQGKVKKSTTKRVSLIENEIKKIEIDEHIDYYKHFLFVLADGVSNSESFLVEAIYNSEKFPCTLIGASAGGKFDFQNTYIFNDTNIVQNSAVLTLIKVQDNIEFGIFKTQNFKKTDRFFTVNKSDSALRYIKTITRQGGDKEENIIDYLCDIFECSPKELSNKFSQYSFALNIAKSLYIRSVASVDLKNRLVYFYADIDYGDKLYVCKTVDIAQQTKNNFKNFMKDKDTKPIAGILNDCILRRVYNEDKLHNIRVFDDIPFIGFSTFGEFMGTNINQTLTAIFFFEVSKEKLFKDKFLDNFIINYANYHDFFKKRKLKNIYRKIIYLNQVLKIKTKQVEEYKKISLDRNEFDRLKSLCNNLNSSLKLIMRDINYIKENATEIKYLLDDDEISEDYFENYIQNNYVLSDSAKKNLEKVINNLSIAEYC